MPDVDGIELLRHVRAEPSLHAVPVVSESKEKERGEAGAAPRAGAPTPRSLPLCSDVRQRARRHRL